VVSDDPAVVKNVGEAIAAGGMESIAVSTGEDALWHLENDAYDAVFGNVLLRGMSGLEMAEEIGASHPGLPVYLIGEPAGAVATTGATGGILQLPVTAEKVAEILRQLKPPSTTAREVRAVDEQRSSSRLKDIVLFLMGPLIAFGYILLFPVIGLGMIIYSAVGAKPAVEETGQARSARKPKPGLLKAMGMLFVIGITGVFYGLVAPFMGIVLVIWFSLEAWRRVGVKALGPERL